MNRRILVIDAPTQRWRLWTLQVEGLQKDPREDYFVLSGEALCQYILRRDPGGLVIACGPMPFLSGNKASVGYTSPLTGVPHYSFVGGQVAAQLFNLGLDALWFQGTADDGPQAPADRYVVISGRAPDVQVAFRPAEELPTGQRSAYYWLLEHELGGDEAGSILTLGEGARLGYRTANLAAEAVYPAGQGGGGFVLARSAAALVLRGEPLAAAEYFAGEEPGFARNPDRPIAPLLRRHCARCAEEAGGTKFFAAGASRQGRRMLPAWNGRRLGHPLAGILRATRHGRTGCHGCRVRCRHWHWVEADYAPGGRDRFLEDLETTYDVLAALGLTAEVGQRRAGKREWLALLDDANRRLILPIAQMGCDVMDIGLALAALLEGAKQGLVPDEDLPDFIAAGPGLGDLEGVVKAVALLRSGEAAEYPALRTVADGPQALVERYPEMRDVVFTCGEGTLSNAGHGNALWAFLMPFSRLLGHYPGRFYRVDESLPRLGSDPEVYQACFERVVRRMLARECFGILGNALSMCALTFVVFSQDGRGERLSDDNLLVRMLRRYGIHTSRADLVWFGQAFWAQSMDLKCRLGWRPPSAQDVPQRIYEALAPVLDRPPEEVLRLMGLLIEEWKRQAGEVMTRFGYDAPWLEEAEPEDGDPPAEL